MLSKYQVIRFLMIYFGTNLQMLKKSSHRKETDVDFEEKKLNLGLGEEELDKENDYYTRPASPNMHGDAPPP
jgi:nuclear protein NHN1